jgi:hypothetical protein
MKAANPGTFGERFDRFIHWFFSTSPSDVEPYRPAAPRPATRAVSRREAPRLRQQHAGPVRVAAKRKP